MQAQGGDGSFVLADCGVAGGNAAITHREEGFTGRVILFHEEAGIPWEFQAPPDTVLGSEHREPYASDVRRAKIRGT